MSDIYMQSIMDTSNVTHCINPQAISRFTPSGSNTSIYLEDGTSIEYGEDMDATLAFFEADGHIHRSS